MDLLKNQLQLRKERVQQLIWTDHLRLTKVFNSRRAVSIRIGKNIAKPTPRLQRRRPKRHREVVDQERPVCHAQTVIKSDVVPDAILKQHQLERLSPVKPQIVRIEHRLDTLRDFNVNAGVVDKDPRVDEVRLSLDLAAPQTRQQP